jgi:hypothetical protein
MSKREEPMCYCPNYPGYRADERSKVTHPEPPPSEEIDALCET